MYLTVIKHTTYVPISIDKIEFALAKNKKDPKIGIGTYYLFYLKKICFSNYYKWVY